MYTTSQQQSRETIIIFSHKAARRKKEIELLLFLSSKGTTCSNCEVSCNGSAMGWDFFQIFFDPGFIEKLLEVHPDIEKEEGHMIEQQFVLWLSKQFRNRIKSEYHLKLSDVPYENIRGFRLNPENYRYDSELEELR